MSRDLGDAEKVMTFDLGYAEVPEPLDAEVDGRPVPPDRSVLAILYTVLTLLLVICSPAIVIAVYRTL